MNLGPGLKDADVDTFKGYAHVDSLPINLIGKHAIYLFFAPLLCSNTPPPHTHTHKYVLKNLSH